ncbi:MAG: peptide chain release factor N(5)-glutamine methyltransferase, partial [Deltaproteobacteria bacterium]|nr:peptide chain release factor N(5)-glutamine methyltransferase [Deltaproteobacteria bacterium]
AIRNNVDSRVNFLEGDLFGPLEGKGLEGKAQMVLSNPPYVPLTEREKLEPEVRDYEPHAALFGGEDGLAFYRRIIREAPSYLMKGGYLILEIGWGQANEITGLLKAEKYEDVFVRKDYAGIERVVRARVRRASRLD